ncbi:shikimate kinase 1 [Clostridiales bacterium]|nr:shikimate kinase 1 [Clostridiales bacterium]
MKNVVLVGFMGCGKTSIGKKLARLMNYEFVDMDIEIEKSSNMKITEIFEICGEEKFRKMETELCMELSERKDCVIATGGGVIKNEKNIELLRQNGIVIYLKASPEDIYRNLRNDCTRPLLAGGNKLEKIKTMLAERRSLYEERSDISAEIGGMRASEAAEIIKEVLKEKI